MFKMFMLVFWNVYIWIIIIRLMYFNLFDIFLGLVWVVIVLFILGWLLVFIFFVFFFVYGLNWI